MAAVTVEYICSDHIKKQTTTRFGRSEVVYLYHAHGNPGYWRKAATMSGCTVWNKGWNNQIGGSNSIWIRIPSDTPEEVLSDMVFLLHIHYTTVCSARGKVAL